MYRVIVLCVIASLATAAVVPDDAKAEITKYESSSDGAGNYKFSYVTSNGITREETGNLVNVGQEDEHIVVSGSYSYIDVDGKLIVVRYTADKNGYRVNPPKIDLNLDVEVQVISSLSGNVVASLLGK